MKESLKHFELKGKDEIILIIVIILVGLGSFGLGRLSVKQQKKEPISIINSADSSDLVASVANSLPVTNGGVVGSKNGKVYHLPWCPGALKIKPENLITFENSEEAEKAGYNKASNCKGL